MTTLLVAAVLLFGSLLLASVPSIRTQRSILGREGDAWSLRRSLRWSGSLFAGVPGPLLLAKFLVTVLAFGSEALFSADGSGMLAGVGVAWLVLPMALLVIGTSSLRLPAAAVDLQLDTRSVIRLADGCEWSLVPLGAGFALALLVLLAGSAGAAMGRLEALLLLPVGIAMLLWLSRRAALRYRELA